MNKNVVLGVVAFGGLLLLGSIYFYDDNDAVVPTEVDTDSAAPVLPSDFVNRFPTYPESTIDSVQESKTDTSQDVSLGLVTTDSIAEVNEWYREALGHGSWTIKSEKNVGGYQIIQAESGNLYTSMQAANGSEAGTVNISQHLKIRQ